MITFVLCIQGLCLLFFLLSLVQMRLRTTRFKPRRLQDLPLLQLRFVIITGAEAEGSSAKEDTDKQVLPKGFGWCDCMLC